MPNKDILRELEYSGDKFCKQFMDNLQEVFTNEKSHVIGVLNKVDNDILSLLRIKLFLSLVQSFPEFEKYDLVTRRKKNLMSDDIYVIGHSLVNDQGKSRLKKILRCDSINETTMQDLSQHNAKGLQNDEETTTVNNPLKNEQIEFLTSKFTMIEHELIAVHNDLKKCLNELKLSRAKESQLMSELSLLKKCLHDCKCVQEVPTKEVYMIGSTVLREVRNEDLVNGEVSCIQSGLIKDARAEIKNIEHQPKVIITQLGGNDIDKSTSNTDDVTNEYTMFLTETKERFPNAKLVISGLPPRFPSDETRTKVTDFNDCVNQWCMENSLQFINNQDSFELKTGKIDSSVYIMNGQTPAVHLNRRGTIRLLENIQKTVPELKLAEDLHRVDSRPTAVISNQNVRHMPEWCPMGRAVRIAPDTVIASQIRVNQKVLG